MYHSGRETDTCASYEDSLSLLHHFGVLLGLLVIDQLLRISSGKAQLLDYCKGQLEVPFSFGTDIKWLFLADSKCQKVYKVDFFCFINTEFDFLTAAQKLLFYGIISYWRSESLCLI